MSADISKEPKKPKNDASDIELPEGAESTPDVPEGVSEDVYRFWKENGTTILVACGVALASYLGIQGWKHFTESRENSLREQFASLESVEEKVTFADSHKGHALAGFAYLEAAKGAFEDKEFETAADYYEKAGESLDSAELKGFAAIGEASSLHASGNAADAMVVLEDAAADENFAKGIRAEAMFKLIVIALEDGQDEVVETYTAELEAIDETRIWTERLESIRNYQ